MCLDRYTLAVSRRLLDQMPGPVRRAGGVQPFPVEVAITKYVIVPNGENIVYTTIRPAGDPHQGKKRGRARSAVESEVPAAEDWQDSG